MNHRCLMFLLLGFCSSGCADTNDSKRAILDDNSTQTETQSEDTGSSDTGEDTETASEELRGTDTSADTEATEDPDDSFAECIFDLGVGGTQDAKTITGSDGGALRYTWRRTRKGKESFLRIEVLEGFGGPSEPGVYDITDKEASYTTCGLCVVAQGEDGVYYMPVPGSGRVVFDELSLKDETAGQRFAGSMELELRAVELDPQTFETAVIEDGCSGPVSHDWNIEVR